MAFQHDCSLIRRINYNLSLQIENKFQNIDPNQMSVLASRRKTLFQLNAKLPDYKKKPTNLQPQSLKKTPTQFDQSMMTRRRFQSTIPQPTIGEKQNYATRTTKQHPMTRFINNTQSVSDEQLKKFSSFLYKGVKYSVNLKQPSTGYIQKRKLSLKDFTFQGQQFDPTKKLLVLDLDQTLIHSVGHGIQSDVTLKVGKNVLKFNIRPYCYRFLDDMSKLYNIIVYTAATESYALPIVEYLNKPTRTVKAVLSRNHCLETHNGFHIKDLRIIKQFDLKDIIIVDNLVHSFAFQLDNGVPILQFLANKKDRQLYYLSEKLSILAKSEDIRKDIKKFYNIHEVLEHQEGEFIWNGETKY